jgi:hypothetical protein
MFTPKNDPERAKQVEGPAYGPRFSSAASAAVTPATFKKAASVSPIQRGLFIHPNGNNHLQHQLISVMTLTAYRVFE